MKQITLAAAIGTLSLLLILNNNEYQRYRVTNKKDIITLNSNIVSLGSSKTKYKHL